MRVERGRGGWLWQAPAAHSQDVLLCFCSPPRVLSEPQEAQKLAAERARAPVVPYGVDLHYWGQELPTAGKILK